MASIEFVRVAGYPVKVTSLARDDASGSVTLVVITRGSADRNHLNDLLETTPLNFEVPDQSPQRVRVDGVDARSVGEGEQVITRFSIRLKPVDSLDAEASAGTPESRSIEDRLDTIEQKIDRVLEALESHHADT